jgi:hypothetical protein
MISFGLHLRRRLDILTAGMETCHAVTTNSRMPNVAPGSVPSTSGEPSLRLLAKVCASSGCPTIYASSQGTLLVQGYAVSADRAGVDVPEGELLVEIPADLLAAAARCID